MSIRTCPARSAQFLQRATATRSVGLSRHPFLSAAEVVLAGFTALATLAGPLLAQPQSEPPWSGNSAEITSYTLEQSRYGERHPGHAVLIFVTEPFSLSKHVKLDDWAAAGSDRADVLKLNFMKSFLTGVYPYTMMLSVFTPVDAAKHPHTLKTTASIQEWCGHVWSQLNRTEAGFRLSGYSYFESEGDVTTQVPDLLLEDELWTRLRLNPDSLPTGTVRMLPGAFFSRLVHRPQEPADAELSWADDDRNGDAAPARTLTVQYSKPQPRTLAIRIERDWPHAILGWTEHYESLRGDSAVTRAERRKTLQLDYWNRNSLSDRELRLQLDIPLEP